MQVSKQIDQLIVSLNNLRPSLSEDQSSNYIKFSNLLKDSIENSSTSNKSSQVSASTPTQQALADIPSWVNPEYGYDPKNPRKPNMRELVEAISGKSVEELYEEPCEKWSCINHSASEMLYGVVGANSDTRDWPSIMEAEDILAAARSETGDMYGTKVDIESKFDNDGSVVSQIAVLKDKNGNTLREVPSNTSLADETLKNFGATNESIPTNLAEKVVSGKFDEDLFSFLQNFSKKPEELDLLALKTATKNISKKLLEEIPKNELEKL